MRITLGNIDGKAYGLNASEACVYAAIEKCSRGDNAKGWYGTMQMLAEVLPFKIGRMSVSRAIAKLLTLGLVREDGEKLYSNAQNEQNDAQNEQNDAQNEHENAQIEHENAQNDLPPITPLYINKEKMRNEISSTHTHTRDAANPDPSFEEFIELYKNIINVPFNAMMKNTAYSYWLLCSRAKKLALMRAMECGEWSKPRPDWCINDYPEPEPHNYNGQIFPDEPMVIAKYNGVGGMYTARDAEMFNMTDVKPFN